MGYVPVGLISISRAASAMHAFKNINSKEGCKVAGDRKGSSTVEIVFAAMDYLLGQ